MTTAQVGYEPVYRWIKNLLGRTHTTVVVTVAWAVLCLLVAQHTTPAPAGRACAYGQKTRNWLDS